MSTANSIQNKLRLVGLAVGLIGGVGLTCTTLFAKWPNLYGIVHSWKEVGGLGLILSIPIYLVLFGSITIAWKLHSIGIILVIVEGIALIVYSSLRWVGEAHLVGFLVFLLIGLSLLVSGFLFLLSWREKQKQMYKKETN